MQVLSNLYNVSSQARTKPSLQDDKSSWNPIIRHKSISKNLHGKQSALGESVAKNAPKSGTENAALCDCRQHALFALHSARQHSKGGEWLWETFKNKELFTFSLGSCQLVACPTPSCPALSSLSPHQVFLSAQGTFWCLSQRRRIFIGVGEERGQRYSPSFSWGSGAALSLLGSVSLEKGWWLKGTLVGFGITLTFCVVSLIWISLKIISWLSVVWGQH